MVYFYSALDTRWQDNYVRSARHLQRAGCGMRRTVKDKKIVMIGNLQCLINGSERFDRNHGINMML